MSRNDTFLLHVMVKVARLDNAFSYFFKLEASPVEGQSLSQKADKERRPRKREKKKPRKVLRRRLVRFLRTPEQKCRRAPCQGKERHAAMLRMSFCVD